MAKKPRAVAPGDYDSIIIAKFWSKVGVTDDDDECWFWLPGKHRIDTYGSFNLLNGLQVGAHRFALILHYGGDHPGLLALHSCDRPACCNPSHLWWGTYSDNMKDCASKGRMANQQEGWRTREDEAEYVI